MKTVFLTTFLLCFLLAGCEKERFPYFPVPSWHGTTGDSPAYEVDVFYPGDTTKGISYALKNSVSWKSGAKCNRFKKGDLYFWTIALKTVASDNISGRETIGLSTIPEDCEGKTFVPQQYRPDKVEPLGLYVRAHSDGDVFLDSYVLDTTATDNFIRIDRLDRGRKLMQGAYSLTFKIVAPRKHPSNPLRVKFSEGLFGVKLPN